MMRWLRNASIRTKFLTVVMAVTTISLLLAAASLFAWDYRQFRLDIMKELSAQAGLVIENSTAAITFRDHRAATETLQTLAPNTHIRLGCLYDGSGALFAQFAPGQGGRVCPPLSPPFTNEISRDAITVAERRPSTGRATGSVYLESDTDAVADRVRVQAATVAFVLVLTVIVALMLSASFAGVITGPIDALVNTSRAVSSHSDYSLRARKTTGDELGVLVDAFNGMLGHIERAEREREVMLAREREANRLKDEFLMTLSHELRTPLNAIQGWTNLLSAGAIPPSGIPAVLQKVERNVRAQARLLEDLLDVSRFAAGKFRLDPVPLDLVVITHQAIDALRATADAQGVSIDVETEVATAPLLGDPDRLQQVIWNLLSNAIKFSASSDRIVCRLSTVNGVHEVVIADQGIGIAPDFLPLMFEPFRQADASTTRAHSGLGLGLAISRRIVEAHGGTIEATSAGTGHGSTFTLRLPASQTTPSADDAVRATTPPRGDELRGTTILVADDDADSRELIKTLLEGAGARVWVAASAAEALQLARASACDVLITDIAMPDQDGFALLAALRREPGVTPPRIAIALTAQVTPRYEQLTRDAGFHHHVAKPFNQHELIALIRQALHRR
ncbi:MAG: response regulator [Acidobacteria bacterium]|nr:response regulator [Acidobacteriota bacterium]